MKRLLTGIFLIAVFFTKNSDAQTNYKMQEVAIQTRWAKQINAVNVLPEYPRPQLVRRQWVNLNGLWQYVITDKNILKPAKYEGKILVPYPIESALSGVKKPLKPEESIWYKKNFIPTTIKEGERLLLNFGAVSWEATVFINGKKAGEHSGAYSAFSIDITKLIKQGKNELVVKVSNPLEQGIGPRGKQTLTPNAIFYTSSSGIWQTVWMETVPANYVEGLVITPDVDAGEVRITVNSSSTTPVEINTAGRIVKGK